VGDIYITYRRQINKFLWTLLTILRKWPYLTLCRWRCDHTFIDVKISSQHYRGKGLTVQQRIWELETLAAVYTNINTLPKLGQRHTGQQCDTWGKMTTHCMCSPCWCVACGVEHLCALAQTSFNFFFFFVSQVLQYSGRWQCNMYSLSTRKTFVQEGIPTT